MKKIFIAVTLLCAASLTFASEIGLGIRLGNSKADAHMNSLNNYIQSNNPDYFHNSTDSLAIGGDLMFAQPIDAKSDWGLRIGYETTGSENTSFNFHGNRYPAGGGIIYAGSYGVDASGSVVPLTAFYRYNFSQYFNVWGGGGLSMLFAKLKNGPETYRENKPFPHLNAGVEWRVSQVFGISFDARYSFAAKTDEFTPELPGVALDVTGFSGAGMVRWYIDF